MPDLRETAQELRRIADALDAFELAPGIVGSVRTSTSVHVYETKGTEARRVREVLRLSAAVNAEPPVFEVSEGRLFVPSDSHRLTFYAWTALDDFAVDRTTEAERIIAAASVTS